MFQCASYVIYMKMIQFLISSSAVWVVMDCVLQLVLIGTSDENPFLQLSCWKCCLHLTFSFHLCISNLFRVFGCTPGSTEATTLEASKNPMRWFYVKVLIPSMTHLGTRVPMVNLLTNLFISAGDKLLPLQGLHDHLGVVYHGL